MAKVIIRLPKVGAGLSVGRAKLSVEADGVKGGSCTTLTQPFEQALLAADAEQEIKPEMYETPPEPGIEIQQEENPDG